MAILAAIGVIAALALGVLVIGACVIAAGVQYMNE